LPINLDSTLLQLVVTDKIRISKPINIEVFKPVFSCFYNLGPLR
jgi:hypothetical protein